MDRGTPDSVMMYKGKKFSAYNHHVYVGDVYIKRADVPHEVAVFFCLPLFTSVCTAEKK